MNDLIESEEEELNYIFFCYCTFISLSVGKKLNFANVFLYFLKNKHLRNIFKKKTEIDNDYDAIQLFLRFDSSLYKSKYVMKYLNSAGKSKLK